jgi:hypothetical protein
VALTPEIQETIIAFIRAGAFDYVAAQAAGISPRTFHDYMARGEGRNPTRRPTARLRAFAQAVRRAQAEARVAAETRVFQERPHWWLTHTARTLPGQDGWTAPPKEQVPTGVLEQWMAGFDETASPKTGTLEERLAEIERQDQEETRRKAQAEVSGCSEGDCACVYHERRYDDAIKRHTPKSD